MRCSALPALALAALGCAPRQPPPELSAQFVLTVAATADVHGRLRGWDHALGRPDSSGDLARAATIVDSVRSGDPEHVILVDAGDALQGSPLTDMSARLRPGDPNPAIAAMGAMGYTAAAIGEDDLALGAPALDRAATESPFPLLAANVYELGGRRAYPAWRIVQSGPVRVAVIGAVAPDGTGGTGGTGGDLERRMMVRDAVSSVRTAVRVVRELGASVVVVLLNAGPEERSARIAAAGRTGQSAVERLAREVPGVDLIVNAHSARGGAGAAVASPVLLQPGRRASSVALARLLLERREGRWRVVESRSTLVPTAGRRESPRVIAATARAHRAAVAYARAPLGQTPAAWSSDSSTVADTPVADFVLETERLAAGAQLASTPIGPLDARLDSGAITPGDIARLYPYERTLRAVRISGRTLRQYLERSASYFGTYGTDEPAVRPDLSGDDVDVVAGVDYTVDLSRPAGERITELVFQGQPVTDTATFTLALGSERQSGAGGYDMLRDAPVVYDERRDIRQLLVDEVRRRGTIRSQDYFTRNWRIVPTAAAARAGAAMRAPRTPDPASAAPWGVRAGSKRR